ncbi:MAG: cyoB [Deltaproteobacteria bacterium]|nr:cyoB [Deltaproteobacteria bacterium]
MAEQFRTCPTTGLKVHLPAETLIKVNAVAAVVCLLVGGLAALLILLTRWPAVHLLNEEWFYRLLTAHALDMLIAWIIFFEVAALYFGATVLLNNRLPAPKVGWVAFILMLAGGAMINYTVLVGEATVAFTSYVPLKASPTYYLGVIFFAVGTLTAVFHFFAALVVAKKEKTYEGSLPMVTFGLMCAGVIAVLTLLHGAAIYIPTFLWSLGIIPSVDPMIYRLVFWGLGHPSQQINVCAMVSVWYLIATLTTGAKPLNEKLCRTAFLLYVLFINVASEHHLLVDPALSIWHKILNTSYVMHLAVLASMIHRVHQRFV